MTRHTTQQRRFSEYSDRLLHRLPTAVRSLLLGTGLVLAGIAGTLMPAQAQVWSGVFGPTTSIEDGYARVTPVQHTCDTLPDGYIAVGYSTAHGFAEAYVVRTDIYGSVVWAYTYDISQDNRDDIGRSIEELSDGSGFVVAGDSHNGTSSDIFLMKIDCFGVVQWTSTYGTTGDLEFATDVIEAQTGDANSGTAAGDIVVTGYVHRFGTPPAAPPVNVDAYLFRTTNTGTMIWDALFDGPAALEEPTHEEFNALTEATIVGTAKTGDIIAVGFWRDTGPLDGYVVRVDGNTGALGGTAYQNVATFGGCVAIDEEVDCHPFEDPYQIDDTYCLHESFNSVIELQNGSLTDAAGQPDVVVVGYSDSPGNPEVYAVRLDGGDPCKQDVDRLIGSDNVIGPCGLTDVGQCVREITWDMAGSGVDQYDLVVSGYFEGHQQLDTGIRDNDAMLFVMDPATFSTIGKIQVKHGQTGGARHEEAFSIEPVPASGSRTEGFIFAGKNIADPLGVSDPADLYLVKTDNVGSVYGLCDQTYQIFDTTFNFSPTCISPSTMTWTTKTSQNNRRRPNTTADTACYPPGSWPKGVGPRAEASTLTLVVSPNPIRFGGTILADIGNVEGERMAVRLVDAQGRRLWWREADEPIRSVEIPTVHLSAGTYWIVVGDGKGMVAVPVTVQ